MRFQDGRVRVAYNTSFKDMVQASKHFEAISKTDVGEAVFRILVNEFSKDKDGNLMFQQCGREIGMAGEVGSATIKIEMLGRGHGSIVSVENWCKESKQLRKPYNR
jgi:hypothetical protein